MHVARLPRRLWYRWGAATPEIEYGTDIPTLQPEIKCDVVQVTVPPTLPQGFSLWGQRHPSGAVALLSSATFWSQPWISNIYNYPDRIRQEVNFSGLNQFGQTIQGNYRGVIIFANTYVSVPAIGIRGLKALVILLPS